VGKVTAQCLPRKAGVSAVYKPRVIFKTLREMGRFYWRRKTNNTE
jgi:hypothetical protein